MTESKSIPARLHVLLAREAPYGLVIRRGPSKRICTIGWDRKTDTFQLGQWMKGKIYERRSDLSPDGRHFIYFALNGRRDSETRGSWTALSRTPHLKAVGLWGKGDGWHGGGLFVANRKYWVNGFSYHFAITEPKTFSRETSHDGQYVYGGECLGVYYLRLQRDGWNFSSRIIHDKLSNTDVFEKPFRRGWVLRKLAHATCHDREPGKGVYYDEHALVNPKTEEIREYPVWEWADIDHKRLVWCESGVLYAGSIERDGTLTRKALQNFNDMEYKELAAPYE